MRNAAMNATKNGNDEKNWIPAFPSRWIASDPSGPGRWDDFVVPTGAAADVTGRLWFRVLRRMSRGGGAATDLST